MRQDEVVNPWAVCHAQLGKKKTKKFERCVMKVKAKHGIKEDAEYIDWFLKEASLSEIAVRVRPGRGKRPQGLPQGGPYRTTKEERRAAARSAYGVRGRAELGWPSKAPGRGKPQGKETPVLSTGRSFSGDDPREQGFAELQKRLKARKKGEVHISSHTEYEGPTLAETKDWIQKAINPAHKGYCTPMTKETCTPARKAFAKRAKRGDI